jgi:hypothetical protein
MLVEKKRKETEREYAHTEVYHDGKYLGYYMKNNSTLAVVNENWNFVTKSELPCFHARTKNELLESLKKMCA